MPDRRKAVLVFLFFGLFYTLTNSFRSTFQMPDEEYVLEVTKQLVTGGSLALPPELPKFPGASVLGKDGQTYSAYQIGQSLIYAPFYWVTREIIAFSEPQAAETWVDQEARRFILICPALFAALACSIFYLFAARLGFTQATTLVLVLLFGTGTMVWPYSKTLLTEGPQNALLLASTYLLFAQRHEGKLNPKKMALAGACFGLLLSVRAIFAVALPVLAFYWFYRNAKERRLLAPIVVFGIPMLALLIPQFWYDQVRFGNILSTGYAAARFSTPLYVGLFGYFLSPGKSLFLYTPLAILFFFGLRRFFRRSAPEGILFSVLCLLIPIKYAAWWVWSGDPSWGPRYLLVLLPYLLLPAGEVVERAIADSGYKRRLALGLLASVSIAVQLLGVSVHYKTYLDYVHENSSFVSRATPTAVRDSFFETEFVPEYSPIAGHAWIIETLITGSEKTPHNPPWSRLVDFGTPNPLDAKWDFWIVDLFRGGFHWNRIKPMLVAFIFLVVWTIVGQELFRTLWLRRES